MKFRIVMLLTLLLPVTALAASFNCQQATVPDEKAICDNRALNDQDVEMATKFHFLTGLFAMGMRDHLRDEQQQWLAQRQRCGANLTCLNRSYQQRLQQLDNVYAGINKPL